MKVVKIYLGAREITKWALGSGNKGHAIVFIRFESHGEGRAGPGVKSVAMSEIQRGAVAALQLFSNRAIYAIVESLSEKSTAAGQALSASQGVGAKYALIPSISDGRALAAALGLSNTGTLPSSRCRGITGPGLVRYHAGNIAPYTDARGITGPGLVRYHAGNLQHENVAVGNGWVFVFAKSIAESVAVQGNASAINCDPEPGGGVEELTIAQSELCGDNFDQEPGCGVSEPPGTEALALGSSEPGQKAKGVTLRRLRSIAEGKPKAALTTAKTAANEENESAASLRLYWHAPVYDAATGHLRLTQINSAARDGNTIHVT